MTMVNMAGAELNGAEERTRATSRVASKPTTVPTWVTESVRRAMVLASETT